ncbi:FAD binding domain-containing protein [Anaerocolumna cellulosilytica]|uniref:FAD binding domain-containing protein n=1 Tax=Anaerocolumna cellulosilytica TaxID=433286 RepID=UPI001609BE4F|nr:FAD binding domain-containing protein [Anaerocolumna cellulosilytica]MBB5195596.1 xanthine dehydrogenase small subunit [Anaerocolumna cellulosilytica]
MKKTIRFFLNGNLKEIQVKAETTVLELLRNNLELRGIKEGCGEGDCGACTVVIGEVRQGKVHYKSAAGCLYLAAKLEGKHLITIEGLSEKGKLHPIQEAILGAHATQCGFCTPGVSLSILALYLERESPTREEFRRYLEGNLCRCTGYVSLREVPEYLKDLSVCSKDIRPGYLTETEEKQLHFVQEDIFVDDGIYAYYSPVSEDNLLEFLHSHTELTEGNNFRYINGGSDVVVGIKKRKQHHRLLIDLSKISSLQDIIYNSSMKDVPENILVTNVLTMGGSVSLSRIIDFTKKIFPVFSEAVEKMCSEQVRSSATLAGNIVNASPVADTVPLLMAVDAKLTLGGPGGERRIPVIDFFHGYKKTKNKTEEWISSISIPLNEYDFIHFEKVSKRKEVDISAVNSAIALKVEQGTITKARIACGGVGATTLYMPKTSKFLEGKEMKEETFLKAFKVIVTEAAPIGDVRGSAEYRKAMMQNLLMKHYLAYKTRQEVDGYEA